MIELFMDVHVHSAITDQLRLRNVDVLTAQEDGSRELSDSRLLERATELGRILFTQDVDLLTEAASRQRMGVRFVGVIYSAQKRVTIGKCIDDLELIAKAEDLSEWVNRVEHLPLK
jgi:hypothetical protein